MKFLKKIKESRLNLILLLLYPIVTFYLLEWFTHNPWKTMKATPQVLNIVMFELVALLLFALFGRLHAALMTETLFFFLYGLVNYFVLNFRSVPIQPWDLFSISTAASVADNYEYTLDKQALLVVIGFLVLLILEFFCRYTLKKGTWKFRIPTAAVVCALLVAFGGMFHSDEIVQQKLRLYDKLFTPTTISFKNGTALAFVMELRYISVDKPAGYNADAAREELAAYAQPSEAPERKPNIIVIMDEAFSDPAVLADFQTNEDYMPFMHSMMAGADNTVSGWLNVSVLGGNTANTEFEYLTGNTMAFLPTGSIPYQQYVLGPTASLASILKVEGYSTLAFHPGERASWQRDRAYPRLGFDSYKCGDDMDVPQTFEHGYVSDQSDFEQIIWELEHKEEGKPLFLFNVTIQNHGGYTVPDYPAQITVADAPGEYPMAEQYLTLAGKTDAAFRALVEYLRVFDEPTIVVMFGDHQPSVEDEFYDDIAGMPSSEITVQEHLMWYETPFIIWTNYSMPSEDMGRLGAVYLSSEVLWRANLEMTPYNRFLLAMKEDLPVVHFLGCYDREGTYYYWAKAESERCPYQDTVLDYEALVYNHSLDRKKFKELFVIDSENSISQ